MRLPEPTQELLRRVAREFGTPCYVYLLDGVRQTLEHLKREFGGRFKISYAVKSNPNRKLLQHIQPWITTLDISSAGELGRALDIGFNPALLTFSGPAKRLDELKRAIDARCGELVCESEWELTELDRLAAARGVRVAVLLRINPRSAPKKFGVRMAGRPSQFGIDEEDFDGVLSRLPSLHHLDFRGFHIYSATNSLSVEGLAENFAIMIELFDRFSSSHHIAPNKLIFGSGFGIPYHDDETPLDLSELASRINPQIDAMRRRPLLADAECILEMGRYVIGPQGFFLTSVINEKRSRGTEIRMCDGGLHHHLAACGLMGMVIRRNYPMWNITAAPDDPEAEYMLVGPLCTTVDTLAPKIDLPHLERGSVVAIGSSGAYGLTISPTEFISHPKPAEYLVVGTGSDASILDISDG